MKKPPGFAFPDRGAENGLPNRPPSRRRQTRPRQAGPQARGAENGLPNRPTNEEPADEPAARAATPTGRRPGVSPPPLSGDVKLRFQFRYQPWKDVLDWFAQQAGLSLAMDSPPSGTFNYSDDRQFTPAEAIDLLNSILLTKGYTLVRRGRMLIVVNLEDGVPANLVSMVPAESLDSKGEYELVSTLFTLQTISPEEAEAEIKKLIGPQGSVVLALEITPGAGDGDGGPVAGHSHDVARIESPEGHPSGRVQVFNLHFVPPEEIVPVARQMLGIPEDKPAAADGSIRVAQEPGSNRIVASGAPEKVARVAEVVKALDLPPPGHSAATAAEGSPQLEVYAVASSDPPSVLAVLQTLLAGMPDVRLALDPKTGNLIAMARPAQQATIRAAWPSCSARRNASK